MSEIVLQVSEPDAIELEYVEAKIKPEVVGHATPTEEAQTVTPAPGTTFSAVELDAIPPEYVVPSGTLDITENAEDINVRDKAAVNVNVQPNLQTPDPVTPTKQQQIITADSGYDGLDEVTVEPIPDEYIVPAGKITLTENATDVDIRQFATADIAVPVPTMPEEYANGGSHINKTEKGYYIDRNATTIPQDAFAGHSNLETVDVPNGVTVIGNYAFQNCPKLQTVELRDNIEAIGYNAFQNTAISISKTPLNLTVLEGRVFAQCPNITTMRFTRNITQIGGYAFQNSMNLTSVIFDGTPNTINATAFALSGIRNIYVPWSEGAVANAPWGATNATIHYDYTGG